MRRPLLTGLLLIGAAAVAFPAQAAEIALFFNSNYVDTTPDATGEAFTLQQTLIAQGNNVTTFTGITGPEITAAVAGKTFLIIPELQNGNLSPDLDDAARIAIELFVRGGGTLIVFDPGDGDPLAVINEVFGFDNMTLKLTSGGAAVAPITLDAAAAAGTPFAGGPATIAINLNATDTVLASSIPNFGRIIYKDAKGNGAVVLLPFSLGNVVIMGWDWFDAQPVGSQDGGWLAVLAAAGQIVGSTAIPTLSEWAIIAMAGVLVALGLIALRRGRAVPA
jgi:exosortase sorting signal-containing protein